MALGWCMSCETLKPIRAVALKLGSRECEWRPVRHDKRVHSDCGEVVDHDDVSCLYICRRCGLVSPSLVSVVTCEDGHLRDIR